MGDASRKGWRWLIALGLLLAVSVVAVVLLLTRDSEPNVDLLIERYREKPDQRTADRLAKLIDSCCVSKEDGARILEALLTPKVIVRDAYPVDKPVGLTLRLPCNVNFPHMATSTRERVEEFGSDSRGMVFRFGGISPTAIPASTEDLAWGRVDNAQPGKHTTEIRYKYQFYHWEWQTKWVWPGPWRRFPLNLVPRKMMGGFLLNGKEYGCAFSVPVEMNLVEPGKLPEIAVRTGDELDRKMRACFSSARDYIEYRSLLEGVSFKLIFRDADGVETLFDQLAAPAGASGGRSQMADRLKIRKAGYHVGTLILRPDPDWAYVHPAITSIWGGELEFPMEFDVTEKKPQGQ